LVYDIDIEIKQKKKKLSPKKREAMLQEIIRYKMEKA